MPELNVPDTGLILKGAGSGSLDGLPNQAFPVTIGNNLIDDLIKCARNGEQLQLSLGANPAILYGSKSHRLTPPSHSIPYDLYVTKPYERTRLAERLPSTMSFWKKPKEPLVIKRRLEVVPKAKALAKSQPAKAIKTGTSSGLDSDVEHAQNSLAATSKGLNARPGKDTVAKTVAAARKNKLLPGIASSMAAPKSMPSSPALLAQQPSPSLNPASASQQAIDRAKELRFSLVHELAVRDRSRSYLLGKWEGDEKSFETVLAKITTLDKESKLYVMRKQFYLELDVWTYEYKTEQDRESAIENAERQFKRLRIGDSESVRQKLLRKDQRGRGKAAAAAALGKGLAKPPKPEPPKIKIQNTDDAVAGDSFKDDSAAVTATDSKARGESMSRSSSQTHSAKTKSPLKKLAPPEPQQTKRPAPNPAPPKKAALSRPAVKKAKEKAPVKGSKPLSAEYIKDSDSDSEDEALAKGKPAMKAKPVPAASAVKVAPAKSATKAPASAAASASTSAPAPVPAVKRRREEEDARMDDDSSSSCTPLSKKLKTARPKMATGPANVTLDASQNSRKPGTMASRPINGSSHTTKNNTSPVKSSPLASSPPTNASDLEQEPSQREREKDREKDRERDRERDRAKERNKERERERVRDREKDRDRERDRERLTREAGIKKKKAENDSANRTTRKVSPDLEAKSRQWQTVYKKYVELHFSAVKMADPPRHLVDEIHQMRGNLATMKGEIFREMGKV